MPKKSFKDENPALRFISAAQEQEAQQGRQAPAKVQEGAGPERKTRRLNLLLQPSVLDDLQKVAHMQRRSVNDLIGDVLRAYNEAHRADIEKYEDIFGE